jgi:hypothetical protein
MVYMPADDSLLQLLFVDVAMILLAKSMIMNSNRKVLPSFQESLDVVQRYTPRYNYIIT